MILLSHLPGKGVQSRAIRKSTNQPVHGMGNRCGQGDVPGELGPGGRSLRVKEEGCTWSQLL